MVYGLGPGFYEEHVQHPHTALGAIAEDGTLGNMTALWVARNRLLAPRQGFAGVETEGIGAALAAYGLDRCVIMNPMTDMTILKEILDEQEAIYRKHFPG